MHARSRTKLGIDNHTTKTSTLGPIQVAKDQIAKMEETLRLLKSSRDQTPTFYTLKPEVAPRYMSMNDVKYIGTLMETSDKFLKDNQDRIKHAAEQFGPIQIANTVPARPWEITKGGTFESQSTPEPGTAAAFRKALKDIGYKTLDEWIIEQEGKAKGSNPNILPHTWSAPAASQHD